MGVVCACAGWEPRNVTDRTSALRWIGRRDGCDPGATVPICPMCGEHCGVKVADLLANIRAGNPVVTDAVPFKADTKAMTWQAMAPGTMGLAHHPAPIVSAINSRIRHTWSSVTRDVVPRTRRLKRAPPRAPRRSSGLRTRSPVSDR